MPDLVSIQFGTDIDEIKINRGCPPKRLCEGFLKRRYNVIRCGRRSCNDKILNTTHEHGKKQTCAGCRAFHLRFWASCGRGQFQRLSHKRLCTHAGALWPLKLVIGNQCQ